MEWANDGGFTGATLGCHHAAAPVAAHIVKDTDNIVLATYHQRPFTNQIAMEKLGVEVDQVVSYFAWADDYGPDGQVRRTFSDMFFAEVRPFEEIFRADQSGASESQQENQNQNGNQGGNQSTRLAELQKQIVVATWKLQRDKRPNTMKP